MSTFDSQKETTRLWQHLHPFIRMRQRSARPTPHLAASSDTLRDTSMIKMFGWSSTTTRRTLWFFREGRWNYLLESSLTWQQDKPSRWFLLMPN
ncbi:MAG: hypothetical protein QOH50_1668 [Kribbellaceae bacterium]|nr:hypothetical protein [Kribbellaceae bacterium]